MILALKKRRPASAMIELVFAIVIIGIVLLSTPMLIQQSINSGYVALHKRQLQQSLLIQRYF